MSDDDDILQLREPNQLYFEGEEIAVWNPGEPDVLTVFGTKMHLDLLRQLGQQGDEPGPWMRVIKREDGLVTVEQKGDDNGGGGLRPDQIYISSQPELVATLRSRKAELIADSRFVDYVTNGPADVEVNAPLALIQVDIKARINEIDRILIALGEQP